MLNNQKTPILMEDFGYLYPTETSKQKKRYGLYKCFCGNEFKAQSSHVKNGNTQSCGCYQKQRIREISTTHGMTTHRLYHTWDSMIRRTSNPKHIRFKDYGERGIAVCERWAKLENFIEDMYPTFKEGLTIDRIDNDKGYNKHNCRWATKSIQSKNTRKIRSNNTSGYRGVFWNKVGGKWASQIGVDNKKIRLGLFSTAIDAGYAYDKYVIDNNLEHSTNGLI